MFLLFLRENIISEVGSLTKEIGAQIQSSTYFILMVRNSKQEIQKAFSFILFSKSLNP